MKIFEKIICALGPIAGIGLMGVGLYVGVGLIVCLLGQSC